MPRAQLHLSPPPGWRPTSCQWEPSRHAHAPFSLHGWRNTIGDSCQECQGVWRQVLACAVEMEETVAFKTVYNILVASLDDLATIILCQIAQRTIGGSRPCNSSCFALTTTITNAVRTFFLSHESTWIQEVYVHAYGGTWYMNTLQYHEKILRSLTPIPSMGRTVYLPTWMVDFYGFSCR